MSLKTAVDKKAAEVILIRNPVVRKITIVVTRKKLMKVMSTIMKIFTLNCQVHIMIHLL